MCKLEDMPHNLNKQAPSMCCLYEIREFLLSQLVKKMASLKFWWNTCKPSWPQVIKWWGFNFSYPKHLGWCSMSAVCHRECRSPKKLKNQTQKVAGKFLGSRFKVLVILLNKYSRSFRVADWCKRCRGLMEVIESKGIGGRVASWCGKSYGV